MTSDAHVDRTAAKPKGRQRRAKQASPDSLKRSAASCDLHLGQINHDLTSLLRGGDAKSALALLESKLLPRSTTTEAATAPANEPPGTASVEATDSHEWRTLERMRASAKLSATYELIEA